MNRRERLCEAFVRYFPLCVLLATVLFLLLYMAGRCPAAVTIAAPAGPVPVDRFVVIPITGAEAEPQVKLLPEGATALVDISTGQPYIVFRADNEGSYELTVIASRARVISDDAYARCLILVGDVEPPPPPPAAKLHIQIIWEMTDEDELLPIDQYLLFNSPKIEAWAKDNGHRLRRRDVDAVDDDGKPVVSPPPKSLPVVRIYDDETKRLLWEGLPKTESEFLETIQRHARPVAPVPDVDCPDGTCPPKKPAARQPTRRRLFRR